MNQPRIVIAYSNSKPTAIENSLAQILKLELCRHQQIDADAIDFYLFIDQNGLALQIMAKPSPGPLRVEFSKLHKRIADALLNQNLLKSFCQNVPWGYPVLWEATLGCGEEIFILCAAVCLQITFVDLASYPLKIPKCNAPPDVRHDLPVIPDY